MTDQKFYYFKIRGQPLGPFDLTQIQQRATRAQINSQSEISTDGSSWQPARNFPEVFAGSLAAPLDAASGPGVVEENVSEETGCWFYMLNGEQRGPVTQEQIQQIINLKLTDHVWMDGMADRSEIRNVPSLTVQQPTMQQPIELQDAFDQYNALEEQGKYQEALPFAQEAVCLAEANFGKDDGDTSVYLNNLG